jgi:hypothetical protein
MKTEIIIETARATLAGTISFPEAGARLAGGQEHTEWFPGTAPVGNQS